MTIAIVLKSSKIVHYYLQEQTITKYKYIIMGQFSTSIMSKPRLRRNIVTADETYPKDLLELLRISKDALANQTFTYKGWASSYQSIVEVRHE
jgi:hypothetical protein